MEKKSIFINNSHLEWKMELSDTNFEKDPP
jgi:hypothetical protein